MLGYRLRCWPNIKITLIQCILFADKPYDDRKRTRFLRDLHWPPSKHETLTQGWADVHISPALGQRVVFAAS